MHFSIQAKELILIIFDHVSTRRLNLVSIIRLIDLGYEAYFNMASAYIVWSLHEYDIRITYFMAKTALIPNH